MRIKLIPPTSTKRARDVSRQLRFAAERINNTGKKMLHTNPAIAQHQRAAWVAADENIHAHPRRLRRRESTTAQLAADEKYHDKTSSNARAEPVDA